MKGDVEWDDEKAASNLRKHGVSFREAATVFADPAGVVVDDLHHSEEEDRFFILGYSQKARILMVAYTYRIAETLRLVSARRATHRERQIYEEARG
jgi:uncharacterized DUF497 family protein